MAPRLFTQRHAKNIIKHSLDGLEDRDDAEISFLYIYLTLPEVISLDKPVKEMKSIEDYSSHCLLTIELFEQIFELEPEKAANLIRYIYSEEE